MPLTPPQSQLLGQLLVERGLIEPSDLARALRQQRVLGGRLGSNLLDLALLSEADLLSTLGRQRQSPTVAVAELQDIPAAILNLVPEHLVRRHSAIPFAVRGNTIHLAVKDAIDLARETEISDATARLTRSFLTLELRIEQALDNYYRGALGTTRRFAQIAERLERGAPPTHQTRRPSPSELLAQQWDDDDASALADTAGVPINWDAPDDSREISLRLGDHLDAPQEFLIEDADAPQEVVLSTVDHYESRSFEPRSPVALIAARKLLVDSANRHNVAQIVLDSCARAFKRRVLLGLHRNRLVGWAAEGQGVTPHRFDQISVDIDQAPAFLAIRNGAPFWLGPLGTAPGHTPIVAALGGDYPSTCLILPLHVAGRLVGFFYLDNREEGVAGAPIADLQSLSQLASASLERIIAKKKAVRASRPS